MKMSLMVLALVGTLALAPAAQAGQNKSCQIVDVSVFLNDLGELCVCGSVEGELDVDSTIAVLVTDCQTGRRRLAAIAVDINADGTFEGCAGVGLLNLIALNARVNVHLSLLDGQGNCCDQCGDLVDLGADVHDLLGCVLDPALGLLHR
jgi:hypothetical protein